VAHAGVRASRSSGLDHEAVCCTQVLRSQQVVVRHPVEHLGLRVAALDGFNHLETLEVRVLHS
jgi:hypothetical protein